MKAIIIPLITDDHIKKFMLGHIKKAMNFAIFQHEVDHLKKMYTKYLETTPADEDRFKDIEYCDKLLA